MAKLLTMTPAVRTTLNKVLDENQGNLEFVELVSAFRLQNKADDLLAKLGSLRADAFQAQADPALKTPALVVNASFDGGKMETVTIARSGSNVVASRPDEPGSATVAAMPFDELLKALDGVK